jgi:HTH-type transcriptional regulator / antitoxin HipB
MRIQVPADLGAAIRERRKTLGMDQRLLAKKAGTSRQWVVALEGGKPRAAIGLVLRTLQALGLRVMVQETSKAGRQGHLKTKNRRPVDVNQVIYSLRRKSA